MRKRIFSLALILSISLLSGCDYSSGESISQDVAVEYSDFELVVDPTTDIVYIDNTVYDSHGNTTYHVYTPYYSKNGKICKFVDGKIVDWE